MGSGKFREDDPHQTARAQHALLEVARRNREHLPAHLADPEHLDRPQGRLLAPERLVVLLLRRDPDAVVAWGVLLLAQADDDLLFDVDGRAPEHHQSGMRSRRPCRTRSARVLPSLGQSRRAVSSKRSWRQPANDAQRKQLRARLARLDTSPTAALVGGRKLVEIEHRLEELACALDQRGIAARPAVQAVPTG
jgi:hypothetical protein